MIWFIDARINQVFFMELCQSARGLRAFVFVFSAGLFILAGPIHVFPSCREINMFGLLAEVLNVTFVSFVAGSALTVGATVALEIQQGNTNLCLFSAG